MNIPLSRPTYYEEEVNQVKEVLKSGWLTQGLKTIELEEKFAKYCNAKYALTVNSGTAALHLALMAHGIKEGDEVIVPTITFVATPNVVVLQRAKPVFAEVSPETCNIDVNDAKKRITKKTKAIMPVHLHGHPADIEELIELAEEKNLAIIEDVAQANGAEYKGKTLGSFNTTACFSFHPMKNMTTGEGGMIVSNNDELMEKIKRLRSHGEVKTAWQRFKKKTLVKRSFAEVGYNYRMPDILAAIGLVQLKHLDENNTKRIRLAKLYSEKLKGINGVELPTVKKYAKHVFNMYAIKADKRDELAHHLFKRGVLTGVHHYPCHLEEIYVKSFNCRKGDLPIAEKVSSMLLSLPMYPALQEKQIEYIARQIKKFKL